MKISLYTILKQSIVLAMEQSGFKDTLVLKAFRYHSSYINRIIPSH